MDVVNKTYLSPNDNELLELQRALIFDKTLSNSDRSKISVLLKLQGTENESSKGGSLITEYERSRILEEGDVIGAEDIDENTPFFKFGMNCQNIYFVPETLRDALYAATHPREFTYWMNDEGVRSDNEPTEDGWTKFSDYYMDALTCPINRNHVIASLYLHKEASVQVRSGNRVTDLPFNIHGVIEYFHKGIKGGKTILLSPEIPYSAVESLDNFNEFLKNEIKLTSIDRRKIHAAWIRKRSKYRLHRRLQQLELPPITRGQILQEEDNNSDYIWVKRNNDNNDPPEILVKPPLGESGGFERVELPVDATTMEPILNKNEEGDYVFSEPVVYVKNCGFILESSLKGIIEARGRHAKFPCSDKGNANLSERHQMFELVGLNENKLIVRQRTHEYFLSPNLGVMMGRRVQRWPEPPAPRERARASSRRTRPQRERRQTSQRDEHTAYMRRHSTRLPDSYILDIKVYKSAFNAPDVKARVDQVHALRTTGDLQPGNDNYVIVEQIRQGAYARIWKNSENQIDRYIPDLTTDIEGAIIGYGVDERDYGPFLDQIKGRIEFSARAQNYYPPPLEGIGAPRPPRQVWGGGDRKPRKHLMESTGALFLLTLVSSFVRV